MPDMLIEARLRQYEWISDRQRDAERHISGLLTALLLSNSFLVTGYSFIAKDSNLAACAIGAIGVALCLLIAAVNLHYKSLASERGQDAGDVYKRPMFDGVVRPGIRMSTKRKGPGLLSSSYVAVFWAPALFLILWAMLIVFAI